MRILLTGHKGQLGRALQQALDRHTLALADLPETDITNPGQIIQAIADLAPDLVVHPAAYTDTAGCQRDPDLAYRVNALGTRNVAWGCQRASAALLYISSNEVFDGRKGEPYLEWEPTNPLSVYARSKQAGEWYVQTLLERHYIVRIAWLYSRGAGSFITKTLQWARTNQALRIVTDEIATPTYAPDLAQAIAQLIEIRSGGQPAYGVYHFTNSGQCSRYDWARRILALAGLGAVPVTPALLADFPEAVPKPANSALRNFCGSELGIKLRPWEEALEEYFRA
jgi:dTDP-4-dehydrorhamnose reductase